MSHPQDCHLTGVIGEGGRKDGPIVIKNLFFIQFCIRQKNNDLTLARPAGQLRYSLKNLLLRFMIPAQFSRRNNILMHQFLLKNIWSSFVWCDGMNIEHSLKWPLCYRNFFLQLMIEQLTEGSFFSEAEVILCWSPFSSWASSHQTGGRSHPVTNIVNNKMSERKWGKKAGGIFETQIMQGNHFSAFRVCPASLIRVNAHPGNHMTGHKTSKICHLLIWTLNFKFSSLS